MQPSNPLRTAQSHLRSLTSPLAPPRPFTGESKHLCSDDLKSEISYFTERWLPPGFDSTLNANAPEFVPVKAERIKGIDKSAIAPWTRAPELLVTNAKGKAVGFRCPRCTKIFHKNDLASWERHDAKVHGRRVVHARLELIAEGEGSGSGPGPVPAPGLSGPILPPAAAPILPPPWF